MSWQIAALSGGASLLGGMMQNRANQKMAQQQMDFQERMSSTAHQREVEDLRKAGLNPILSAGGSGASSPSGATAHMEDILSKGVNSALEGRRLRKELDATDSQVKLNDAIAETQKAQALANQANAQKAVTEINMLNKQMPAIEAESKFRKNQAESDDNFLKYDAINRRVRESLGTINSAKDIFNPFKGLFQTPKSLPKGLKQHNGNVYHEKTGEIFSPKGHY